MTRSTDAQNAIVSTKAAQPIRIESDPQPFFPGLYEALAPLKMRCSRALKPTDGKLA